MLSKQEVREKQEKYFMAVCGLMKSKSDLLPRKYNANLNRTELQLISEVVTTQYKGERIISTQLAKRIGVTRSAVSQMVMRLEKEGILRRIPSDTDKKIAYVEIADGAYEKYGDFMEETLGFLGELIDEFGEENFQTMCELFNRFTLLVDTKSKQRFNKDK